MDQPPPTVPPPEPSAGSRSEPPSPVRLPAGASVPLLLSAVGAGLLAVRLLGPGWAEGFPATWPDAVWPDESYLALAEQGPFRPGFWLGFRPPVYPLFCWALFRDSRLIVVAQTLLAAGSVAVLALTAARTLRSRPVAVPAVILIVAIPLQARYSQWHTQILSESLAASLGLLAIAAWWRFADRPSPRRAGLGAVTLAAWMLIRDAHVISAVAVLVPLLGLVAATGRSLGTPVRRALAATVAVIVAGAGYSLVAESRTHRARLSFHNTIGVRVLPDPELSRWFAARGMPLDDALRGRTGRSGLDDDFYRSEEPAFARYRQWVDGPGRRAMAWSLVALAHGTARSSGTTSPRCCAAMSATTTPTRSGGACRRCGPGNSAARPTAPGSSSGSRSRWVRSPPARSPPGGATRVGGRSCSPGRSSRS
ncbi:MAG: hypothetical protein ACKO1Y_08605, partial [Actinomycetota bacterium]